MKDIIQYYQQPLLFRDEGEVPGYTVAFGHDPLSNTACILCLNEEPEHPSRGVSQFSSGNAGCLGTAIGWHEIPRDIHNHIINRLKDFFPTIFVLTQTWDTEHTPETDTAIFMTRELARLSAIERVKNLDKDIEFHKQYDEMRESDGDDCLAELDEMDDSDHPHTLPYFRYFDGDCRVYEIDCYEVSVLGNIL